MKSADAPRQLAMALMRRADARLLITFAIMMRFLFALSPRMIYGMRDFSHYAR